jgi:hypothetical protein
MPSRRVLALAIVSITVLSGCSIAREKARLTFDYHVLEAGRTRSEVEKEFGKPDSLINENDRIIARYSTIRVDDYGKDALAASRVGLDIFTVGAGELFDPAALSENENKVFIVGYQDGRVAGDVLVTCPPRGIERKYYRGFTCSTVMQG